MLLYYVNITAQMLGHVDLKVVLLVRLYSFEN